MSGSRASDTPGQAPLCPHRRPPRRKTPTKGCRGRGSLHCGHNDAWPRVSLAREPAIASTSLLFRTSTRYSASGRGCPRSHQRVNVRIRGPRRGLECPRARGCAFVTGPDAREIARIPTCARVRSLRTVSHAIRLSELSTVSTNVAIPTMHMCGAILYWGNCMRHSSIARPTGVKQCRRRGRGQARREPRWCHNL